MAVIWNRSIIQISSILKSRYTVLNIPIITFHKLAHYHLQSISKDTTLTQLRQVLPHFAASGKLRLQITYNCHPVKVKNSNFCLRWFYYCATHIHPFCSCLLTICRWFCYSADRNPHNCRQSRTV